MSGQVSRGSAGDYQADAKTICHTKQALSHLLFHLFAYKAFIGPQITRYIPDNRDSKTTDL